MHCLNIMQVDIFLMKLVITDVSNILADIYINLKYEFHLISAFY